MDLMLSRRGSLGLVLLAALEAIAPDAVAAKRKRARLEQRACRVQGHPCEVGGQECCPIDGKVVECRVTGPGAVTRCATVGEPDPIPVDPVVDPVPPTDGGGGGGTGGRGKKSNRKLSSGRRCTSGRQCKSHHCKNHHCCDANFVHCDHDSDCCSGNCIEHAASKECAPIGHVF